jgi:hypothetical protein
MLDKTTRIFTENLARAMDRRGFMKRASQTTFAGLAALAAGQAMPMLAAAAGRRPQPPMPTPQCAPPGPYCNTGGGDLSGCHGGSCFQHLYNGEVLQCRYWYFYQAGCWTTPASGGGYWTCCDCACYQNGVQVTGCGCAQHSSSPVPRPDGPSGSSKA